MMISALVAAFSNAGLDITLKNLLSRQKLPLKYYHPYLFLFITLIATVVVLFDPIISSGMFSPLNLLLLVGVVGTAVAWNVLVAESLQSEPLHEYELIMLMTPLMTLLMAALFLPEERNVHVFIAGFLASIALMASRLKKHHFVLTKSAKRTLLAVFFISIEAILIRKLLGVYSPPMLYLIRVVVISFVFFWMYKPDNGVMRHSKAVAALVLAALFGTSTMIFKYYAFESLGVSLTTVVLLLGPLSTYLASYFYFRERRNFKKDLIYAGIIVICVAYGLIMR